MGTQIEIEFSVNFDPKNIKKPKFGIVQIRPLVISKEQEQVKWNEGVIKREDILVKSNKSLGNGAIENIKNIVYVKPDKFDSSKTIEMVKEIEKINNNLEGEPYILIGPGRWGTQDKFLGIPVKWSDISNAKIIIETNLETFNIKPSQGTHFFQNIISKEVGYINTDFGNDENYLNWEWLKNLKPYKNQKYTAHIKLDKPLSVKLDGRFGRAIIFKN
jgi:hypothetical protein